MDRSAHQYFLLLRVGRVLFMLPPPQVQRAIQNQIPDRVVGVYDSKPQAGPRHAFSTPRGPWERLRKVRTCRAYHRAHLNFRNVVTLASRRLGGEISGFNAV
jgi:hypothetical protein